MDVTAKWIPTAFVLFFIYCLECFGASSPSYYFQEGIYPPGKGIVKVLPGSRGLPHRCACTPRMILLLGTNIVPRHACSSFKTLVEEVSAEEAAAREASDAKAEAEAEAEARRKAAEKAKLDAEEAAKPKLEALPHLTLSRVRVGRLFFFPHVLRALPRRSLGVLLARFSVRREYAWHVRHRRFIVSFVTCDPPIPVKRSLYIPACLVVHN